MVASDPAATRALNEDNPPVEKPRYQFAPGAANGFPIGTGVIDENGWGQISDNRNITTKHIRL